MSNKDIEFYMSLRYPIVLTPLTSEEGGGWFAEIRELPGCAADGETPQEAMESIEESKRLWLSTALKEGRHIPLPESDQETQYSGRLTLRMPRTLHKKVAELARREGISLNQFLLSVIAFKSGLFESEAKKSMDIKITVSMDSDGTDQDLTDLLLDKWVYTPFSEREVLSGVKRSVRTGTGTKNTPYQLGIFNCEVWRSLFAGYRERGRV